jgi:hypothetical protein
MSESRKRPTQSEEILDYMRNHGRITQMDAYGLGCTRLAARISDLKRAGHLIKTEMVTITTAKNRKTNIAAYSLVEG